MAGEGIDVEGPGNQCALDQVRDEIIYSRILLVGIEFGIFLTFSNAYIFLMPQKRMDHAL